MRSFALICLVAVAAPAGAQAPPRPSAEALGQAVAEVERLDAMRSGLAGTFAGGAAEPDRETFARVCKPVGARAQALAREHGWHVIQMAARNRNPAHALDAEGRQATRMLEHHRELTGLWIRTIRDGVPGSRYFRRIVVEQACLACHGAAEARPAFVREGYPEDRAFGFAVGDLRGIYAVFVPDSAGR